MDKVKNFVSRYQEHFVLAVQLVLCLLFAIHAAKGSIPKAGKKTGKKKR